jgi:hypothetical protein
MELDLSRLAQRLVSEDGLQDSFVANLAIEEYKKFFSILIEFDSDPLVYLPSTMVDLVWQRHMLDTFNYHEDCITLDIAHGYLHRYDSDGDTLGGMEDIRDDNCCGIELDLLLAYSTTLEKYRILFGEPPELIWPKMVSNTAFAMPSRQCLVRAVKPTTIDLDRPTVVESLIDELMWIGDMVYESLPKKQLQCADDQPISLIAFPARTTKRESVKIVVLEYVRFLLLLMKSYSSDEEKHLIATMEGEVTPSKLVDELWHAHILQSTAYASFW